MLELISIEAKGKEKIAKLCELNLALWKEFYSEYFDEKLINYICFFIKPHVIKDRILDGVNYFFISENGNIIGFIFYSIKNDILNFSGIYLLKEYTRQKIGFQVFEKMKNIAKENNIKEILAYIDKDFLIAQNAFIKWGFENVARKVRCIGNNYCLPVFEFVYFLS